MREWKLRICMGKYDLSRVTDPLQDVVLVVVEEGGDFDRCTVRRRGNGEVHTTRDLERGMDRSHIHK
jgi:hypothetical protein